MVTNPVEKSSVEGAGRVDLEDIAPGEAAVITAPEGRRARAGEGVLFRRGDVLFGKLRPYLKKSVLCERSGLCSPELLVLRPDESLIDPRFLHYIVQSSTFASWAEATSKGVKMPRTDFHSLGQFKFDLPSLAQQRRSADFLDSEVGRIDNLAAARRHHLRLLEDRWTTEISTAIDASATTLVPFKRVLAGPLSYGANEAADRSAPTEPRYIRITDIRDDGTLRDDTHRSLPSDVARPYLLDSGDLLFARSGATVGKAFLYDTAAHDTPACYAGYLLRARIDRRKAIPRFVYYWARTRRYWDEIGIALIQATIPNVSAERYATLPFPAAGIDVQRSIVDRLDQSRIYVNQLRGAANRQLRALRERRDAVITAAVAGELGSSPYRALALRA